MRQIVSNYHDLAVHPLAHAPIICGRKRRVACHRRACNGVEQDQCARRARSGLGNPRFAPPTFQLERRQRGTDHFFPKHGSMNTAVVRAGTVNVPVLLLNFDVRTTGSCENTCTGCSTSG